MATDLELIIGNKNYSTWSLRPWLLMKHFQIQFHEHVIPLDEPDSDILIRRHSPSGKVPVLKDGSMLIWETTAIVEHLAEKFQTLSLWPREASKRALARSISSEMHSSFHTMREKLPMNCRRLVPGFNWQVAEEDIKRVLQIWTDCRKAHRSGPYLFGDFSIADAMYAPAVFRFRTYDVPLIDECREYSETMLSHPWMQTWLKDSAAEPYVMPDYDNLK